MGNEVLSHAPIRVLCVDDNAELLSALRIGLTVHQFEVVTARNLAEAYAALGPCPGEFSWVLTDHEMPDGTGAELCERLRRGGYQGRIVVMSAGMPMASLALYQNWDISGFFQKPFGLQSLLSLLQKYSILSPHQG